MFRYATKLNMRTASNIKDHKYDLCVCLLYFMTDGVSSSQCKTSYHSVGTLQ